MTTETMRAAICVRAGGPEVLQIREVPVPTVREGWSLVRVKGAGLNRSELRTRQGHSRSVRFPRVLGIECVGIVAASTDPAVPEGTTVAAVMGELGREFVGARTVLDSLRIVRRGGTVCVAGSLSGWAIPEFEPIAMIPPGTRLTAFHSDSLKGSAGAAALQRVVREVEAGVYRPHVNRVFGLDDIVAAHRYMESNEAAGKLVVVP